VQPALSNHLDYLSSTNIVDWQHPDVRALAADLGTGQRDQASIARECYEWVRDEIQHSMDFGRSELTCKASEVLAHRTGFCYAKSHLLAALLRANDIPAGFCYQRLSIDGFGAPFSLHGLNAVWLSEFGWYRIDPRGNKLGVNAQFTPPFKQLAFPIQFAEEFELSGVLPEPLPVVVDALTRYTTAEELAKNLPDYDQVKCC
jgi:transglutaminase-like putative cysteine protease